MSRAIQSFSQDAIQTEQLLSLGSFQPKTAIDFPSNYFRDRRILLTGASGFIGQRLRQRFLDLGATVHAISRTPHDSDHPCLCWHQGEVSQYQVVKGIVETIRPEIMFHLASYVSGSRDLEAVLPTLHSNLVSTVNLMTAATQIGCQRIILTGSLEEPDPETGNAIPGSPYAAAKWACSSYAQLFHALYQLPVVNARLFMVYGPTQKDFNKLIPYVTLSLLQNEIPQLSSGERHIDWIYIDDAVDGLLTLAQTPGIEGQTFEIGSGTTVSIREVVNRLTAIISPTIEPLFGSLPDRPMERVRVANLEPTLTHTGWQPKTSLQWGLEQTVDWYRGWLKDQR